MSTINLTTVGRREVGMSLRQYRAQFQRELQDLTIEPGAVSRDLNALNKAAIELEASNWQWCGSTLAIDSRTTAGKRYYVTHGACTCKAAQAGRVCWHAAAYELLQRAARIAAAQQAQPRQPKYSAEDAQRIQDDANAALFA